MQSVGPRFSSEGTEKSYLFQLYNCTLYYDFIFSDSPLSAGQIPGGCSPLYLTTLFPL